MTTLEVFCHSTGWQGGTIHQAKEAFNRMSLSDKDKICNALMLHLNAVSDIETLKWFTRNRLEHLGVNIVNMRIK